MYKYKGYSYILMLESVSFRVFLYSHPYTHKYLGRFPLLMPVGDDLMSLVIIGEPP